MLRGPVQHPEFSGLAPGAPHPHHVKEEGRKESSI